MYYDIPANVIPPQGQVANRKYIPLIRIPSGSNDIILAQHNTEILARWARREHLFIMFRRYFRALASGSLPTEHIECLSWRFELCFVDARSESNKLLNGGESGIIEAEDEY